MSNIIDIEVIMLYIGLLISAAYILFMFPNNNYSTQSYPRIQLTLYPILYRGMIHIPISKRNCLHVHHWLVYSLVILSSFIYEIPSYIIGFSIGLCIHGLMYKDAFQFIKRK